ncbi:UNVERIFIED_CONTAM: hypothetical protein HDU68_007289 [Siphonaria sp. JEL0065]|nr:hypothetical protein HDU68_007289 [Siphonaria sp. JEL0065]
MDKKKKRQEAALRNERRQDSLQKRNPLNLLRISGSKAHISYTSSSADNLITWQGDGITRIDRFDARNELSFLPDEDQGPDISLDPNDPEPQSLPINKREWDDELNFERFRDLLENQLAKKIPEKVIGYIESFWNELYLNKDAPIKNQSPSSSSSSGPHTDSKSPAVSAKTLEDLVSDLSADESLLHLISDLNESHIDSLNALGIQYLMNDAFSCFKQELKRVLSVAEDSRHKNRRNRGASTKSSRRRFQSSRSSDSDSDSSSSSSANESKGFVLEFDTKDSCGSDQHQDNTIAPAIPILPLPIRPLTKKAGFLSALTRDIASSEFERYTSPSPTTATATVTATSKNSDDDGTPFGSYTVTKLSKDQSSSKPLTASEKLKLKAKMALDKQIVADEKSSILFKKRKTGSAGSNTQKRRRSTSPEVDEFGRLKRDK